VYHWINVRLPFIIAGVKLERQMLVDRNRQLSAENTRLNMLAAQLNQRMEV